MFKITDFFRSGLFWRTFLSLLVLMSVSILVWGQVYQYVVSEPSARKSAQQVVAITKITHSAILHTPYSNRANLLADLAKNDGIDVHLGTDNDETTPIPSRSNLNQIAQYSLQELDKDTKIVWKVNSKPGFWVSFYVNQTPYWLRLDRAKIDPLPSVQWVNWGIMAVLLCLTTTIIIVGFVNTPLSRLYKAAKALSKGQTPTPLPEKGPREIIKINRSFNDLITQLNSLDKDRALMLAGISHDLRTPLTRLKLEVELSNLPQTVRDGIDEDIDQINRTIDQFMEYARPLSFTDKPNNLSDTVSQMMDREVSHTNALGGQLQFKIEANAFGLLGASETERIVSNLLENARRYGHHDGAHPEIYLHLYKKDKYVVIDVEDAGPGIPQTDYAKTLMPFIRGSDARTDAGGTGLGLAIVNRLLKRSGGKIILDRSQKGGLLVRALIGTQQTDLPIHN